MGSNIEQLKREALAARVTGWHFGCDALPVKGLEAAVEAAFNGHHADLWWHQQMRDLGAYGKTMGERMRDALGLPRGADIPLDMMGFCDLYERVRRAPRFDRVSCSHCGAEFGPGDSGFSHCDTHAHLIRINA